MTKNGEEGAPSVLERFYNNDNSKKIKRPAVTNINPQENHKRECGSCTECCQGWLSGEAHGKNFYLGNPCHFVCETGCTIYENRPEDPCKMFKCEWLTSNNVPEWMKPDKCKVVLHSREWTHNGKHMGFYLTAVEAGKQIDSRVLAWLFEAHLNHNIPMRIQIAGGTRLYGSKEFMEFASSL